MGLDSSTCGEVRLGGSRLGWAPRGKERYGPSPLGWARLGLVWLRKVEHGKAGLGLDSFTRGPARQGEARLGLAWLGEVWTHLLTARLGKARQGLARFGAAWP